LKPERWGSPLVQEKYQTEKACDKRHPYCIIIIIIIKCLTNYKKDHFVNIVKSEESTQPNMNSIIKTAGKITRI